MSTPVANDDCTATHTNGATRAPNRSGRIRQVLLILLLIVLLLAVVPAWPHSRSWGYRPSGVLGTVLLVVIVLALLGRI